MSVHKSGAFLQQCFSVHPLCLNVKLVSPPQIVGVLCTNCQMRHRLTLPQALVPTESGTDIARQELFLLQGCVQNHPHDVRVSLVHIEQSAVEFKCGSCHRTYELHVALFETHQS
ncbi:hypothetical protein [Candidatus Nitrospira neomarina]|uniref:Uncharacterized protein n=1 Tax=Candidatus Nitrospira neomarina TaxID=3020899 RepID=A0AA96GM48_9BACT|nr:hypothetical protein [Candidatus Nitrospira neomarina]WNM63832.1 hypothetical protein PQG83_08770 [Candidatus Nitrospira neomarina]